MVPHKFLIALLWPTCMLVAGCQTTQSAFDTDCKVSGTAIGAVAGGVAGALLFGKGDGKIGTALLGAAAGALVGNQLAGLLDCQDQKAMTAASQTAAETKTGERVVWASASANVPVVTSAPAPAEQTTPATGTAPAAKPKAKTTTAPKPKPQTADSSKRHPVTDESSSGQWSAVEPVRSSGNSGSWGWVEPVSPPSTAADGRTCRQIRQVAVDKAGTQTEEEVTTCQNEQKQWVVATR